MQEKNDVQYCLNIIIIIITNELSIGPSLKYRTFLRLGLFIEVVNVFELFRLNIISMLIYTRCHMLNT